MRLIDADEAVAEWYRINDIDENDRGARFVGYTEIPRWLYHIPTIEAEPVRHGERKVVPSTSGGYHDFRCSECRRFRFHNGEMIKKYHYCPNCGAKMDGGDNEKQRTDSTDIPEDIRY